MVNSALMQILRSMKRVLSGQPLLGFHKIITHITLTVSQDCTPFRDYPLLNVTAGFTDDQNPNAIFFL